VKIMVTGAGGFIGGHLVKDLYDQGHEVIATDIKPYDDWWQHTADWEYDGFDLRYPSVTERLFSMHNDVEQVYDLAADMGGIGFITSNKVACMRSSLILFNLLDHAMKTGVEQFFFSSSACVYPQHRQLSPDVPALKEDDAYPADCEDGYGWEKLFGEQLCAHYAEETPIATRVARYHNVYGPRGTIEGGREKAPAAICRKIALAKLTNSDIIEIWGDGEQTRSFMFVDDCVYGSQLIMNGMSTSKPLNLGSAQLVTINQLVDIVEEIAGGYKLHRQYLTDRPQGVRGRNSDNYKIQAHLGWEPKISLEDGLLQTYRWVYDELAARG
jgi:GDP-D-mannose 3',5'-epimerase